MWWLIPIIPYLGGLILILVGKRLTKPMTGVIGCGSVGLSALLTIIAGIGFLSGDGEALSVELWKWFNIDGWSPGVTLYLDALSLVFIFVITFVGFLIHVYSIRSEEHPSELQSLMRISYAVFCLNKKIKQ